MIDWEVEAEPFASFVVHGTPVPQGSKKAIPIYAGSGANRRFTGRAALVESSDAELKDWRGDVKRAGATLIRCRCGEVGCAALRPGFPVTGPILARMVFSMPRPKGHFRTGRYEGLLRESAALRPTGKPDVGKLARAVEDALTDAGLYKDDALIVEYSRLAKVYVESDPEALSIPGVRVGLWRMVRKEAPAAALPAVVQETVDLLSALDVLDY